MKPDFSEKILNESALSALIASNILPIWTESFMKAISEKFDLTPQGVWLLLRVMQAGQLGDSALFWDALLPSPKEVREWTMLYAHLVGRDVHPSWLDWAKKSSCCTDEVHVPSLFFFTAEKIGFYSLWQQEQEIFNALFYSRGSPPIWDNSLSIKGMYDPKCVLQQLSAQGRLLLCGGPGSGKSTLISKLIEHTLEASPEKISGIVLTAPTARAVQRLSTICESISLGPALRRPMTIHQLLKMSRDDGLCLETRESFSRLDLTLLVVDESSMLPNALLLQVLQRLPRSANLLLVGDGEQLPSVELGGIFQAVHAHLRLQSAHLPRAQQTLRAHVWELTQTYRFDATSALAHFTQAIREHDFERAMQHLFQTDDSLLWISELDSKAINQLAGQGYAAYFSALEQDPENWTQAWSAFSKFRILVPHHDGLYGIKALNQEMIKLLRGRIWEKKQSAAGEGVGIPWMILKNLKKFSLCNGEIGLGASHRRSRTTVSAPIVFLDASDARSWRSVDLSYFRSDELSPAFAMTGHKAQGSEFEEVLIIIPPDLQRSLSVQWLYTALTRAKKRAILVATSSDLQRIFNDVPQSASFFRSLMEAQYPTQDLLSAASSYRYEQCLTTEPDIAF